MSGTLQRFIEAREALIAGAEPGSAAARALSDLTDGVVSALAGAASSRAAEGSSAPFALLATGGYGACRLLPASDIDLLVITGGAPEESRRLVREALYPLWDAGLAASHQVRTPAAQVRAVLEDRDTLTAFLTSRLVAGDPVLAEATVAAVFKKLRRKRGQALESVARRPRPGSPFALEPDLKEGRGGQRDIDELVWRLALENGAPDGGHAPLAEAQEVLTAARWRLHVAGAGNRMTLEAAEDAGVDADAVQEVLALVSETLLEARGECIAEVPGDLRGLQRLAATADVDELERLAYRGGLDGLVPGFSRLMTLRRPALSHQHTVGAHSVRTLMTAVSADAFSTLGSGTRDALALASLVHDVGKREPGPGHAARGAAETERIALRLGLDESAATSAATLVREHLLLSEVAQSRDLSDEDVVLATAARLGDIELVAPLLLLTEADMQATGAGVWTPWRATLLAELAARLSTALEPGSDGPGIAADAERTRSDALRLASKVGAPRRVLEFLEHAPLRYLASRTPDEVLHAARLVQDLTGPGLPGEAALGVRPGPLSGTWLVDLVTRDCRGLFAIVSGCLALAGLDTLSAEAFTDRSGIALDTFLVTSATLAPVETSTWNAVTRALHTSLRDPSGLDVRLAERRRHYPARGVRMVPEIAIGTRGPFTTEVRVRALDRVGLLHDLARAIASAGFDIRRASVNTTAGVARDVFDLLDPAWEPPGREVVQARLIPLLEEAARG